MEFNKIIENRYSVRKYSSQKVEQEKIDAILDTARKAPTAVNYQPVKIIVAQEKESLDKIAKAANTYHTPLAMIVCADKDTAWVRDFDGKNHMDIDASILTDHMMLKATDLGLGSVWICRFDPDIIRREFQLPHNWEPINILALGYPDETSTPSKMHTDRREFSEFVYYNTLQR